MRLRSKMASIAPFHETDAFASFSWKVCFIAFAERLSYKDGFMAHVFSDTKHAMHQDSAVRQDLELKKGIHPSS